MSHRFPIMELAGPCEVELTLEQRYETIANVFVHQFFQLYRILGNRYGWDAANEIAASVPDSSVPLLVEGYRRKFALEGEGAELLTRVLAAEFQAEGSDVSVVDESPEAATFDVLCSFGNMLTNPRYADVKIERGLCHVGCEGFLGDVGATMSPPVGVTREAWMGDGAPRCRFALRRQEAASPEVG